MSIFSLLFSWDKYLYMLDFAHLMGMPVVTPLMIMIAALGIFNFFGMMIMIMMFVPMVMSTLFMSMIVRMCIILLFHIGSIIVMVMMFVPMVMSALLMSVIMCMSVVVIIVLELRYFRFEIIDV